MASRQIQDILNSGEIESMYIGGTNPAVHKVATVNDITGSLEPSTLIDSGDNLNTIITEGYYKWASTSVPTNAPDSLNGIMQVVDDGVNHRQIVHTGTTTIYRFERVSSSGVYVNPWISIVTSEDIGSSVAAESHDHDGTYEPDLSNPASNGYILSSLIDGTRSWVAPGTISGVLDTPEDGNTTAPISANWAYDHENNTSAHGGPYNFYTHPDSDVTNIATSNAEVVYEISTNTTGHVTALSKRTLTLTQLGAGDSATLDVGTTTGTVAAGDHTHSGEYELVDSTILREEDKYTQQLVGELTSVKDFLGFTGSYDGQVVTTCSFDDIGDIQSRREGGGRWYWDPTADKADANLGTIIDPSAAITLAAQGTNIGTGCWIRETNGDANICWWGAKHGAANATETTAAIQACFDYVENEIQYNDGGILTGKFGLTIKFPRGIYCINQILDLQNCTRFKIVANGARLDWTGATELDYTNDEYLLRIYNCSWFDIEGLDIYSRSALAIEKAYRVGIYAGEYTGIVHIGKSIFDPIKRTCDNFIFEKVHFNKAAVILEDCWTFEFNACAIEQTSQNQEETGLKDLYDLEGVHIRNCKGISFNTCYTESMIRNFLVEIDDTWSDTRGGISWNDCYLDVTDQYARVEGSTPDDDYIRLKDSRTTKTPIYNSFIVNNCYFNLANDLNQIPITAIGRFITADDTFMNVKVQNCTTTNDTPGIDNDNYSVPLAAVSAQTTGELTRMFDGMGIYCDEGNIEHGNPIKNGRFKYTTLNWAAMNTLDSNRENNSGWWASNNSGTGDGTFGLNGNGYCQITNGSRLTIHIPIITGTGVVDSDNGITVGHKYFFAVTAKGTATPCSIQAVSGTITKVIEAGELGITGYPTSIVDTTSGGYFRRNIFAFNLPTTQNGNTVTYLQIKLTLPVGTNSLNLYDAKIWRANSDGATCFPRNDSWT